MVLTLPSAVLREILFYHVTIIISLPNTPTFLVFPRELDFFSPRDIFMSCNQLGNRARLHTMERREWDFNQWGPWR